MTSDGIADSDWDRVHELALEVVNCSTFEDVAGMGRAEASLLALLDELDQNYGKKPSLLATRADYVESPQHREQLLREAYSESERMADGKNQELVAHSLASFYVEECRNDSEGARWLETWRRLLGVAPEQDDRNEVVRLTAALFGDSTA